MSLSRSKPLTSRRDCDWECTGITSGGWKKWECSRGCGQGRITPPGEEPPPSRCKGLSRRKTPKRTSRPKPINPEKRKRSRTDPETGVRHTYGDYFRWAVERACCGCGAHPCVPHHLKTVGTGGRDAENLLDVCHACHDQIETEGLSSWEAEYGIDADERARELWHEYQREAE